MSNMLSLSITRNSSASSSYAVSAVMRKWTRAKRLDALVRWRQRPWIMSRVEATTHG